MTYVDRTMACVDCGVEFIHSAADQEYYAQKGFTSDPKRCASCRAYRRSTRDGGSYDVAAVGGPRGYERSEDRGPRVPVPFEGRTRTQPSARPGGVSCRDLCRSDDDLR